MKKTEKSNTNEIIEIPAEEAPYALPDGWKWVRIKDVAKRIFAGGDKPEDFQEVIDSEHMIPVVGNGLVNEGILGYTSKATAKSNTVTVAGRGTIGFAFYRKYDYCPIVRLIVIEHLDCINPKFLMLFLSSIEHKSNGSSIPQLTVPMLKARLIPLPPLETQKRIVERIESLFAKLDEAKEKAQTALDTFELRKSAILHKAFTGELTAQWREENRAVAVTAEYLEDIFSFVAKNNIKCKNRSEEKDDINDNLRYTLPQSWQLVKIKDAYQINPKNIADDNIQSAFIPMEKIKPGMVSEFSYEVKPWGIAKKGHTQFADGDVAFAKITPCFENRKSMVLNNLPNGIGAGTTELIILRQNNILPEYTFWCISDEFFIQGGKRTYSGTVGQQRINMDYVRNYRISLPPFPEQQEIVRILDDLLAKENAAKEAAEAVIEKIDLMKKSILARAFRGEL